MMIFLDNHMVSDKNEIENLIDTMIKSGDELVDNLKTVLPNSLSESMVMFHESHVANLKKIKEFLNPVSYTHLTLPTNREV